MEVLKSRKKSKELQVLEVLDVRMNLSKNDKQHYYKLKKGYEGEILFDSFILNLSNDCLILNDLLLKINNTHFQIDSIIITPKEIFLYEIKNFDGDYYYDSDRFFKFPQIEITNPLHQLSRCESLFRQLLLQHSNQLPINASVIFVNPEFTLYQAPINKPIIYSTQVNRHLNKLNKIPLQLKETHMQLARSLISLHIEDSPFSQIPAYSYDLLQKGMYCTRCHTFSTLHKGKNTICKKCSHEELLANAVIRMVNEFKLLFSDKKITTNIIHNWCQIVESKRTIRSILNNNYKKVGENRWTYFKPLESIKAK